MNIFANYENGKITLNSSRNPGAIAGSLSELISDAERGMSLSSTANIRTKDDFETICACTAFDLFSVPQSFWNACKRALSP